MAFFLDVCLEVGQTATIDGDVTFSEAGTATLDVILEKYSGTSWSTYQTYTQGSTIVSASTPTNYSSFGTFEKVLTEVGVYRWNITATLSPISETTYIYFEAQGAVQVLQPTLRALDQRDGSNVQLIISGSDIAARNKIFIRSVYGEFPTEPNTTIIEDGNELLNLGPGRYFAKVQSETDNGTVSGTTDPVEFYITQADTITDGKTKDIRNTVLEPVTNSFYGNAFLGYFLKIPQVGYYSDDESFSLKSYAIDRINESVRGISLPDTSVPTIDLAYFAHQNEPYMGVGDGNLGTLTIRFLLDRYLLNYTSFLNWSYLKYDWTFGGKNPQYNAKDRELQGTFIVEFLDSEEKRTRKIAYKVLIDTLPSLGLGVDSPDQIEFEAAFKITHIDISQFVEGLNLFDRHRLI